MNINKDNFKDIFGEINADLISVKELNDVTKKIIAKLKERVSEIQDTGKKLIQDNNILKIGVVGQVKAGKSSFLNSLIFNGEDVLPRASTPMTASLTILKFGESNCFEIEYYNSNEWEFFKDKAKEYDNYVREIKAENPALTENDIKTMIDEGTVSAKEMVSECGNLALQCIQKESKIEKREFSNIANLQEILEEYVGSSGKFTSVVKSLTIYLNDERLKDLQIVDTPGVNDPVVSREQRTRSFLRECHGVFFLSYSGRFFDSTDVSFLTDRIGNEGIGSVVLLASKFDSVLQDVGVKFHDDLANAIEDCQKKLKKQFQSNIANADYRGDDPIIDFSSGIGFSIWKKEPGKRNSIENNVISQMQRLYPSFFSNEDDIKETFKDLSQIDVVQEKYLLGKFLKNKESILSEKVQNYFSSSKRDLLFILENGLNNCKQDLNILQNEDLDSLNAKKNNMQKLLDEIINEINSISRRIDNKIDQYKKELFYEWSFDVRNIPTQSTPVTIIRLSTFWGIEKNCQENVDLPNIHKTIDTLNKDFYEQFKTLTDLWKKKIENVKADIKEKVDSIIKEAGKKDESGDLQQRIVRNILADILDRIDNLSTVKNEVVYKFKNSLENTLMSIDSKTTFYYGSMGEVEARQETKDAVYARINEVRGVVKGLIAAIKKDVEKAFDESGNAIFSNFNDNREKLNKEIRTNFDKSIKEYEKQLSEKEKNVVIFTDVINLLTNIKEKIQ
ncbi:MAG: dynamin family protein [Bacteroidales bacterium]|nr:dynamin family protein [Bacteroidales bacterium]